VPADPGFSRHPSQGGLTTLTLSEVTVKTRVARILAKLDLRDRVQAVVLAYATGLVSAYQAEQISLR